MIHFSIIIPTLNEEGNITSLLQRIEQVMSQHDMIPEIIFVDDGSDDGTCQIIEAYKGELSVRLIQRDTGRGLTGAVVEGGGATSHDLVLVMDADLSHPPESIPDLIVPLASGRYDMSIGSRYVANGATSGWPLSRKIASLLASAPARALTGVRDPLAGFFAVSKSRITAVNKGFAGFKIGFELLSDAENPPKVKEVPIVFQDRWAGYSKMNNQVLLQYLRQLMRLSGDRIFFPAWGNLIPILLLVAGIDFCLSYSISTFVPISQVTSWFISLFIIANLGYYFFPSINEKGQRSFSSRSYLNFTLLLLLGIFIRNGLLTLVQNQGAVLFVAVQLLSTAFCLGAAIVLSTIDTSRSAQTNATINWKRLGGGLIFYAVAIKLIYLGNVELLEEEAYYWNYAQHLAPGYLDHPPMVALLIYCGTALFGNSELGVRFLTFLCWFVTAYYTHRLTSSIYDKDTAFRAVVLVAVLPIFFCSGLLSTPDAPLIACWSAALYYLYRSLVWMENHTWYEAGIFIGLGLASKYTMALLGLAVIVFMLVDRSARKQFFSPHPYLAALLAIVIFSPVIWWNYQHDWASFLFQSQNRIQASSEFSTHQLLASILLLISPPGLLAASAVCWKSFLKEKPGDNGEGRWEMSYRFGVTMLLVPLAVFVFFSFTKEIKLNWTGPLWLSVIPFVAWTMMNQEFKSEKLAAKCWPSTLVLLILCYGALLHYSVVGLPGIQQRDFAFLMGWDDFATQVDNQVTEFAKKNGKTPIVAGMDRYQIASGLAFYRSKERAGNRISRVDAVDETTGRQLFGGDSLMYAYWHPPVTALNKDILVVSHKKGWLEEKAFHGRCQQLGDIKEIIVRKKGEIVDRYYLRLLSGYTPDTAKELASSKVANSQTCTNKNRMIL